MTNCAPIKNRRRRCASLALIFVIPLIRILACGPFFPNTLLNEGDAAILTAPEARFQLELARMKLIETAFRAIPATNHPQQTFDAELTDLRAALSNLPEQQCERIVERHREERKKIHMFSHRNTTDDADDTSSSGAFVLRPDPTNSFRIKNPMPQITPGLPPEFADYFRGSIAWHAGKLHEARTEWERLLARPKTDRHYKSTWAAFMLGKSWEGEDADRAISYYRQVRAMAKSGLADTLGLAASTLGWEARLELQKSNFARAIDLYLEHAASGDRSAVTSLRWAASRALHASDSKLRTLAAHPRASRVITAYVISGGWREAPIDVDGFFREKMIHALENAPSGIPFLPKAKPEWHKFKEPALRWLEIVESAGVKNIDSTEQLALAAYQGGQMDMAGRWLKVAPTTPAAQWLRAKLLLRDGEVSEAAALISKLVQLFPLDSTSTNPPALPGLAGSLFMTRNVDRLDRVCAHTQIHAEWGVFQIARRQYTEALDALIRSGYWFDAAYVAERVLTLDELKSYVDRRWPAEPYPKLVEPSTNGGVRDEVHEDDPFAEPEPAHQIRYLLARRLARAERFSEARAYFPSNQLPKVDRYCALLSLARNPATPRKDRATAFFEAAILMRNDGLALIASEGEPDWHVHAGSYQHGIEVAPRSELQSTEFLVPANDELDRAKQHAVIPNKRWHYRFVAASLAWQAAELMPNNSDQTARVLCIAGSWIKNQDPKAADVFYKSLVRRCRNTAIGAEADRLRWFPQLDENGNLRTPASERDQPRINNDKHG